MRVIQVYSCGSCPYCMAVTPTLNDYENLKYVCSFSGIQINDLYKIPETCGLPKM